MASLYSPTILEHFRRPRNYGRLERPDVVREVYNPVCGDRVRLALRLDDGRIAAARFVGDCCAISKAAASLLTGMLEERTLEAAASFEDDALLAALDAEITPSRLQCALLPLKALREGLAEHRVAAVVLAAGTSSRFGENKLLAAIGGSPVIRRTVENALDAALEPVIVVLGRDADAVRATLGGLPVRFVVNPRYADGMSTSLRAGVRGLPHPSGTGSDGDARESGDARFVADRRPVVDAALVVLGDQPTVAPGVLRRLLGVYRESRRPIVAPVYDGTRGNPVLFDADVFPELLRVRGDRGARRVVAREPGRVEAVAFDFPPPPDIDTREDYAAVLARMD